MATSTASAHWEGTLLEGSGTVTSASPALDSVGVTWKARTGGEPGATPEELLGAAHAACFSMALSGALAKAGHEPRSLHVKADVEFGQSGDAFAVQKVQLSLDADVGSIDESEFQRIAEEAKEGCPISKALHGNVPIELNARLAARA